MNSSNHKWSNYNWKESDHPILGEKYIYLVAGERNLKPGLWCNVGETTKTISERLEGADYKRKNAGGAWVILNKWKVPHSISDKQIHQILRVTAEVVWENSDNTEEFFFHNDIGDGKEASQIVEVAIRTIMMADSAVTNAGIREERIFYKSKLAELKQIIKDKEEKETAKEALRIAAEQPVDDLITTGKNRFRRKNDNKKFFPTAIEVFQMLSSSMVINIILYGMYQLIQPTFAMLVFIYFPMCSVLNLAIEVLWAIKLAKRATK